MMITTDTTLVVIGFKGVGKSSVGAQLAQRLKRTFIDLDKAVEAYYFETYHQRLAYQEIAAIKGIDFFRQVESQRLSSVIHSDGTVLSLGGGTPLSSDNQAVLAEARGHCLFIWLQAEKERVFERIMAQGRPVFFPVNQAPRQAFEQLWQTRTAVYQQLADMTVDNCGTVEQSVAKILQQLTNKGDA